MAPPLKMHAVTQCASGNGPVWAGGLFPFLFITIACGAVSGFHALISSGTTPKLIASEAHAPMIGYGAMLMEAFVAIKVLAGQARKVPVAVYMVGAAFVAKFVLIG